MIRSIVAAACIALSASSLAGQQFVTPLTDDGGKKIGARVLVPGKYDIKFRGARLVSFKNLRTASAIDYAAGEFGPNTLIRSDQHSETFTPANLGPANVVLVTTTNDTAVIHLSDDTNIANWNPTYYYKLYLHVEPGANQDLVIFTEAWLKAPRLYNAASTFFFVDRNLSALHVPYIGGVTMPSGYWDPTVAGDLNPTHYALATSFLRSNAGLMSVPAVLFERQSETNRGGFMLWTDDVDHLKKGQEFYFSDDPSSTSRRIEIRAKGLNQSSPVTPAAQGQLGAVIRVNTYAGNWSFGVDALKSRSTFQPPTIATPSWLSDLRVVHTIPSLHLREVPVAVGAGTVPWANDLTEAAITGVMTAVNTLYPTATPLSTGDVLINAHEWALEGHSGNMPAYTIAPQPWETASTSFYQDFASAVKTAGYRLIHYVNSSGCNVAEASPINCPSASPYRSSFSFPGYRPEWNAYKSALMMRHFPSHWAGVVSTIAIQSPTASFLEGKVGQPQNLCPPPIPYPPLNTWANLSLRNAGFASTIASRSIATANAVGADGIYFDECYFAWDPQDINGNNYIGGVPVEDSLAFASFQGVVSSIVNSATEPRLVSSEFTNWGAYLAGVSLWKDGGAGGTSQMGPTFNQGFFVNSASQWVSNLIGDHARIYYHAFIGSPDDPQNLLNFFRIYGAGYAHGVIPTTFWPVASYIQLLGGNEAIYESRGKRLVVERGLYHHQKIPAGANTHLFTGATTAWNNPNVIAVENHAGVGAVARTEEWLVKVLVCDLFWVKAGRAPTAQEFATYTNGIKIRDGSYATQLANIIQAIPDVTVGQHRSLVLKDIYQKLGFTEYPFVSLTVLDPNSNQRYIPTWD